VVADQQKLQKIQKQTVVKTVTKENTEKHKNTDAEPVQCNWFKRTADRDHGDWLLDKEAFDEVRQLWSSTSVNGSRSKRHALSVDGASDNQGYNAYFRKRYSPANSFENAIPSELNGRGLYVNPDFRRINMYLNKLEELWKAGCDVDVALVLPADEKRSWHKRLKQNFICVKTFSRDWCSSQGNRLFTRPLPGAPHLREGPGPAPFDVNIWFSKHSSQKTFTIMNSSGYQYVEPAKFKPHLNVVPVKVGGRILSCLLDDGAQCNIITQEVVDLLKLQTAPTHATLGWFDSSKVPISSAIPELSLSIHNNPFTAQDLLVAPLSGWDLVLGLPFRLNTNMQVNYSASDRKFQCDTSTGRRVTFTVSKHYIAPLSQRKQHNTISLCTMKEAVRLCAYGAEMYYVWPGGRQSKSSTESHTHSSTTSHTRHFAPNKELCLVLHFGPTAWFPSDFIATTVPSSHCIQYSIWVIPMDGMPSGSNQWSCFIFQTHTACTQTHHGTTRKVCCSLHR